MICELENILMQSGRVTRFKCDRLSIAPGGTVLLGKSGSGKTTLLELLAGFTKPQHGRVQWTKPDDTQSKRLPLFWAPDDGGLWMHMTVRDHLLSVQPEADTSARQKVTQELLDGFGLTHLGDTKPDSLSLGEKSRLNLARALATQARVLLMDEPFSHVDPQDVDQAIMFLHTWLKTYQTHFIFSSHRPQAAMLLSDHALVISDGQALFQGDTQTLYHAPPDKDSAWLLGPVNTLPPDAQSQLKLEVDQPLIRPECLRLEIDPSSEIQVIETRFDGCWQRSRLSTASSGDTDNSWLLIHRAWGQPVAVGAKVKVHFEGVNA